MAERAGWFLLGVTAALLLAAGLWAGMGARFSGDANAQGTWQIEVFDAGHYMSGDAMTDPDRYVDDWLHTLPDHCDVVPLETQPIIIAYRCP